MDYGLEQTRLGHGLDYGLDLHRLDNRPDNRL